MNKNLKHKSKMISYALRHKPEEFGIVLDENGWVDLDVFLRAVKVTREDVDSIIAQSEKKRFEIVGNRIRATYGHSIEKKIEFEPAEPPDVLFHGTSEQAYAHIQKEGLKPMNRQYVHLSSDFETAQRVGLRHGKNSVIVMYIDAVQMHKDGFKFYHSANDGTWMCEHVPPKYNTKAVLVVESE